MCNIVIAFALTKYIYIYSNTEGTYICMHKGIYAH